MQQLKLLISAVALAIFYIGNIALAEDAAPVMVKSQSGVVISEHVDWRMCAAEGVAVGGYDLVSYRQDSGPVKGIESVTAEHGEFTYFFRDESNRDAFLADPDYYLPAYSGFCAITLALGRVTCPDFANFKIEDERLFLFEVTGFTNGRVLWNSDSSTFRQQADTNFDRLSQ